MEQIYLFSSVYERKLRRCPDQPNFQHRKVLKIWHSFLIGYANEERSFFSTQWVEKKRLRLVRRTRRSQISMGCYPMEIYFYKPTAYKNVFLPCKGRKTKILFHRRWNKILRLIRIVVLPRTFFHPISWMKSSW